MTMPRYQSAVWAVLVLPLSAAGCNAATELNDPITAETQSLSRPCPPNTPKELQVSDGSELSLVADAEGVQVYVCQTDAKTMVTKWTLERPDALLFGANGRVVAHHYEGPTWEGLDNSTVHGVRSAGKTVDSSAIDWLLLKADAHTGDGIFSKVTWIQRLNTEDGLAPASGCDAAHIGAHVRSPYTATYYFYTAANGGKHGRH